MEETVKYMDQVFRFFGFGNEFINIMNTIGTGRTASIIFEDGSLSKPFNLESGRPQGDCGYLYIIIHTENSYMYLS